MYTEIRLWYLWKKYILRWFGNEREPYLIGYINIDLSRVEDTLIELGYQPNYFSFDDDGQFTSMRIIYIEDGKWRQKHVRAFKDGELRGHDELSYEEDANGHLHGDTLRPIDEKEIERLKSYLMISEEKKKE